MSRVAIVTDTDSSIPVELARQFGIRQVPINIHFGSDTYPAVEGLSDRQLFERVDLEGKLPTTSAPSPGSFAQAYQSAFEEGADEVVCFTVSSKVSAVFTAALSAKDLLPKKPIQVVDTESLSMGQGFMVLAAAEAAQGNATSEEIISHAMQVGKRVRLFAALATLKYLAMSGRVGHLSAGIANVLDIRPILTLKEGKLDLLEKTRTQKKAWTRVVELSREALNGKAIHRMAVLHVNASDKADEFSSLFCEHFDCAQEYITAELTPGLSVHSGSGVVGVAFVMGD